MLNPQIKENADLLYKAGVFRYEPYGFAYEAKPNMEVIRPVPAARNSLPTF